MKKIKFIPKYSTPILNGEKTCTVRYGLETLPEKNEELMFQNSSNNVTFAKGKCKFTETLTIQKFVNETWEGHKEYANVENMIWAMNHFYDASDWDENTKIEVIGWKDITSFYE